jgi:hypothetical protein
MANGTAPYNREPTGLCNDVSGNHSRRSVSNNSNSTAPYNHEPTGLCDDASGSYLRQSVLNKRETVSPLTIMNRLDYAMVLQATIYGKAS